ncbi:tudor domain-containing protein 1 isoform X3 [Sparus aurata]|uniref:Tudor domain-containing protein 1 n=1 Tax=Sparus aurata TaxID=8175 RepID=A0A671WVD8_SPAAU|nr:tudor domain-containing protein 1 isoform X3 [Sparus aurata]
MCNTSLLFRHVRKAGSMYPSFSPNLVRPNLPLRKPSSSPMALGASLAPRLSISTDVTPARPSPDATGDGPKMSPFSRDISTVSGSTPPALTVYFCNYCGQQGNFRCKRCKKTPYCSVVCQTEDWKAHRHVCKPMEPEPVKEKPKETTASPVTEDKVGLLESKTCDDAPSPQRVYLNDLQMTKVITGTHIQASVVEFYSPGRFFMVAQSPELLGALNSISTELQKTYSCPSVTTYVPCTGEVCAVQFSCDMNWYRGFVQALAPDQKKANVLYIDFGNEEDVPVERIRPLAANIPTFCPCAMECRIAGVVPVAGNWSGECCIAVRQLLAGKTVTVKLVDMLEHGRIHTVDIQLSMGKQLSTFLLDHGYAAEETVNRTPTEQEIRGMVSASLENFRRLSDGKDNNTWAKRPEPITQVVGDSFPAVVTHLHSPSEILVQKVENAGVIQELQLKLREHCSQVPAPQNFRPALCTVCCAQFSEDKQWYRAEVLAYSSEERVCVGYLDFGNSEEVDLAHLRPISPELLALPMQAVPCGLAGVQPVGESWSEDCVMVLQKTVLHRILRVEIQGVHEGKALVALYDESSDPQVNAVEMLISAGFSVPAPVTTSHEHQVEQKVTTAAAEPHGPPPACEPLLWSYTELPSDGQTVALLASVVENPQEFYCRINNPTDHQRLIELGAELKQHCEANASPFVPKVGVPCCAKFPGDGAWYRAMVNEMSEDETSVNFVDYGSCMKVKNKNLRPITPRLLTLPFQAVRCSLAGVEPLGSEWSSEALLWFQTLVDGEKLSARVLSVSEQGYNVKLESRGQDMAVALISEQLAKAPGAIPKETHGTTGSEAKHQEKIEENEHSHKQAQASSQTGASYKEIPTEGTATPSEDPSFPVDWKTMELPLNETFQPLIPAAISPSLFYLLSPSRVDQQKLQGVMMELATYCSNNQTSLSSTVLSRPTPGAACCAQFSADNNWYRAVVLEVGENELRVMYADYCNTEKVPLSRILPIPRHLLQLPFQITRCALTGREHFPAEWPEEVLQVFQNLLSNGVLATVQSFDGSANMLSLTLHPEAGGGNLTAMIMDILQAQAKSSPCPSTTQKAEQTDSSTLASSICAASTDCPSTPETQKRLNSLNTPTGPPPETQTTAPQQRKNTSLTPEDVEDQKMVAQTEPPCTIDANTDGTQTSGCCCLSLKNKIDHLEQLVQLQLSLIQQLVAQTK